MKTATHKMQDLIDDTKKMNEFLGYEDKLTTPNDNTIYYHHKNKDGKNTISQARYYIDKEFTNMEEFYESEEMIERFEMYDHERKNQLRNWKRWISEGSFIFHKGYVIGKELFMTYKSRESGLNIIKKISIGSMLHNGGWHLTTIQGNTITLTIHNYANDRKTRKALKEHQDKYSSKIDMHFTTELF